MTTQPGVSLDGMSLRRPPLCLVVRATAIGTAPPIHGLRITARVGFGSAVKGTVLPLRRPRSRTEASGILVVE